MQNSYNRCGGSYCIETTVTICCGWVCSVGGANTYCCWEMSSSERSSSSKLIEYDASELYDKTGYKKGDFKTIYVESSTTVDFDGKKIKIKSGTYNLTKDDKVYLDYELVN